MMISKERLSKEHSLTGFRIEIIEKVAWLVDVLNAIAEDSYLSERLVLKGGTALNLFYFNLPRLSVDADLNYIGEVDRDKMLQERPLMQKRMIGLLERMGLVMARNPVKHAGGKMVWRYPSALGNQGNLEVDLNFMYRIPLLPVERKNSVMVVGNQVRNVQLLNIHEIAAGKLTALLERQAGRDFFDAYELFQYKNIDVATLRTMFVLYAAMCTKKNMLTIGIDDIAIDWVDLKNKLIPVIKNNFRGKSSSFETWAKNILQVVQNGFKQLLPFTFHEKKFIENIVDGQAIMPELFVEDGHLIEQAKLHPALRWALVRADQ
ncbi:MAG: nucleotidyl transferase AbiEii/AbiGii toxin family protein [Coxiellaceae bacterium]|nr:nucleotidyl transferase AbiEii/AbiGii toxin family protein [Coxiellaceae bacterium]